MSLRLVAAGAMAAALGALVAGCGGGGSPAQEAVESPAGVAVGVDVGAGRYLANAALCVWCHTPEREDGTLDASRLMAGGRQFRLEVLGVVNVPNITQDRGTGIGEWTDAEIKAAIFGLGRGGEKLAPPMPFFAYAYLSRKDADDLVAYLRTLPALSNPVPPSEVDRQQLPPLPRARGSVRSPTEGLSRGRYMAQAVSACGLCHTPYLNYYEVDNTMELSGGAVPFAPGLAGPNLTPDEATGLHNWTEAEIVAAVRDGRGRDGRELDGLMPSSAYSTLSEADFRFLVQFLRSLPARTGSAP